MYPAAVVAGNTETSQRIVDVVFGALAQALPDRIPAASCGTMSSVALGGRRRWTYYETIGGGSGAGAARRRRVGRAVPHDQHAQHARRGDRDAVPAARPAIRARTTAAGKGRNRGGDGIIREIEALDDCEGTMLSDRRLTRPYGLAGAEGRSGEDAIDAEHLKGGKKSFSLRSGQTLHIHTPGGGGWEGKEMTISET